MALGFDVWLVLGLVRALDAAQARVAEAMARLESGDYEAGLPEESSAAELLGPLVGLQGALRARAGVARAEAATQARLRHALDQTAGNILVADLGGTIVYANERMQALLRSKAAEIRTARPGFDAGGVVGASFDALHGWGARNRESLSPQGPPRVVEVRLGELLVKMIVFPLCAEDGTRLGSMSQWIDRATEASTEAEIQIAVDAAAKGDLSRRIRSEGKHGFFQTLSVQLNALLDTNEKVFAACSALSRRSRAARSPSA